MPRLDRRSTSFPLHLHEQLKAIQPEERYSFLKYYQDLVRHYINDFDIDSRGLLLYWTMGLGKSLGAMAIAMDQIASGRQVIILLTKSLQDNMYETILKYVRMRGRVEPDWPIAALSNAELDAWIRRNFSFVSMNASNMLKQMSKAAEGKALEEFDRVLEKNLGEVLKITNLNGKLLIVDEAHNLFRAITNGSKNALGVYDMVMKAKNLKVIFLTGTPIANDPFELVPCFNMLGSRVPGKITLPENYKDFTKLFVGTGEMRNKEKFQNRILGLVSYVTHAAQPRAEGREVVASEFPTELPTMIIRVPMAPDQYVLYQLARDKEMAEGQTRGFGPSKQIYDLPSMVKPKSRAASSYKVRSRQLSNYCAPEGYRNAKTVDELPKDKLASPKFEAILSNIQRHSGQLGLVYSQFVGIGGIGTFAAYLRSHGWEEVTISSKKGSGPPDPTSYIDEIERSLSDAKWLIVEGGADDASIADTIVQPSLVVDVTRPPEYKPKSAHSVLPAVDVEIVKVDRNKLRYAIISGDVAVEDRSALQELYNSEQNKHGGVIDLLMISSTGAEGLDLKRVRHIHIMEPYWNYGRIAQIKSRGIRNDSHIDLPPEEKNVQTYIYLAVPPDDPRAGAVPEAEALSGRIKTTDEELFEESLREKATIDSFLSVLPPVSVECMLIDKEQCRVCSPTDEPLYTDDITKIAADIAARDPCRKATEARISGEEIVVDGVKYYYTPDDKSVFDYRVFEFDKELNSYRRMPENDPRFMKIIDAIATKNTSIAADIDTAA